MCCVLVHWEILQKNVVVLFGKYAGIDLKQKMFWNGVQYLML